MAFPAPPPGAMPTAVAAVCLWEALPVVALVVVSWLVVIGAALLVLRAVISEPLGDEQDESDDQISGHGPA